MSKYRLLQSAPTPHFHGGFRVVFWTYLKMPLNRKGKKSRICRMYAKPLQWKIKQLTNLQKIPTYKKAKNFVILHYAVCGNRPHQLQIFN